MRVNSRRSQTAQLACWLVWCGSSIACDPKAGFESAAGAVDPNQKSYVDGPGSRLTAGPFDNVGIDFDSDTGVHLLARRRDDLGQSLTLFGQNAQTGCTIAPNAATWFATKPAAQPYRLLPYLESRDANGAGTLRFSSIDCDVEPYSLDNVSGPLDLELAQGFVVKQGSGLAFADPWSERTRPIVSDFRRLIQVGSLFLVWGDSQLIVLDDGLTELARYGNHVVAVFDLDSGDTFAVEDDDGVHSLTVDSKSGEPSFQMLDPAACGLGAIDNELGWILVHSPCADDRLVGEHLPSKGAPVERLPFAARADSRTATILGFSADDGSLSNVTACFLADVDPVTGLGTLFAAKPSGDPLRIGENATLERAFLVVDHSTWQGVALVGIQNGLGRLVRWSWDGALETLAENVDQAAIGARILANYDGHAGDLLTLDASGSASVVEAGAPPFNSTLQSDDFAWTLRLEHFDGSTGDLALAQGLSSNFAGTAQRVPAYEYEFTSVIPLPGFAYIGDYDEKALAGTLFVQNLSLGSKSIVAQNVSDFTTTNYPLPGILYAVPIGSDAGLWFARAK